MSNIGRAALVASLAALALTPVAAEAPNAGFTTTQAEAGAAVYQTHCSACHGHDLTGDEDAGGTPLVGPTFRAEWFGQPPAALFGFISTAMPVTDPGSLTAEEYAAILAYIFAENGIAAGGAELPADAAALEGLNIPAP